MMLKTFRALCCVFACTAIAIAQQSTNNTSTHAIVPGTGARIDFVGDEFESSDWRFIHNHPKSSREQDERLRFPVGKSTNGRWYEGPERGQPDLMQVVATPEGGLPGSQKCLLVRTVKSGIPGRVTYKVQQDDLIVDLANRIGNIPVSEIPNVTTRVYLPEADRWEDRTGPHFGFRITTNANVWKTEEVRGRLGIKRPKRQKVREQYWPGIWIHFRSATDSNVDEDSAFLTVRGNGRGHDFPVREIPASEFGWWTFGMSVTADGQVHYYAKPGVDDLTEGDYITSQYPYSYRALQFETFFYNFCNRDDGKSWSTPFMIDDPMLFVVRPQRIASIVARKESVLARQTMQQELAKKRQAPKQEAQKQPTAAHVPSSPQIHSDAMTPPVTQQESPLNHRPIGNAFTIESPPNHRPARNAFTIESAKPIAPEPAMRATPDTPVKKTPRTALRTPNS